MPAATPASRLGNVLPWLIPAFGLLTIASLSGWIATPALGAVCKPLTTLLIALHALRLHSRNAQVRRGVLAGLALAVLGDCAFALPATFVAGLYLFVLAQCCHLSVMLRAVGLGRPGPIQALHAAAVCWAIVMWSGRPAIVFVPVAVFLCLLGLMSAQAETWWWRSRGTPAAAAARRAALGGFFWLMADLLWTFSQFVAWVPGTLALVLSSYWLAQWHLASLIAVAPDGGDAAGWTGGDAPTARGPLH